MNIMLTLLKSSGIKPKDISQRDKNQNIQKIIREIIKSYENHPSLLQIKNICSPSCKGKILFYFVNEIQIKKIIQGLNSKKATEIDTMPPPPQKKTVALYFLTPLLIKSINSSK